MTDTIEPGTSNVPKGERPDRLFWAFIPAFFLCYAIAFSPAVVDPDIWGHVQYGEELLAEGAVPQTATHTFTAVGHPWINHENLSEIVFAYTYESLGIHALLLGKCLLGLGVVALMIWHARRLGVGLAVTCTFMLLVATSLAYFWAMRPQLASYALFPLMVVLLSLAFRDWETKHTIRIGWLYLAPPLFAIWANSHGGFVAGLAIFAVYLMGRSLELIFYRGWSSWLRVLHLATIVLLSALATLANPYGIELVAWVFDSLHHPRPEITEWAAPSPSDSFFVPFAALTVITVLSLCATRYRRDWVQILLLGLTFWQAAMHLRHIAFFTMLCGFWLPQHFESLLVQLGPERRGVRTKKQITKRSRWMLAGTLTFAYGLLCLTLVERLRDFPVKKDTYPVAAIQFMADNQLHGRLVVSFNWAQYALAALQPETRVAFDGRFRTCYPQEVLDANFDFLIGDVPGRRHRSSASGPIDPTRVLRYAGPELVLVDRSYKHSVDVMAEQNDWVLLYQDSLAQLWGRRDLYDNPTSPRYVAASRRSVTDTPQQGSVTWPALPVRRQTSALASDAQASPSKAADTQGSPSATIATNENQDQS